MYQCEELWKDIQGYENRYKISTLGNIKSFQQNKVTGKLLKPGKSSGGYLMVVLTDTYGNRSTLKIHRLMALTFLENPDGKQQVNHKDKDVTNNCIDNLEWCSQEENQQHRFGQQGIWPVLVLETNQILNNCKEAEQAGFHYPSIHRVLQGQRKTHRNCTFKSLNDRVSM